MFQQKVAYKTTSLELWLVGPQRIELHMMSGITGGAFAEILLGDEVHRYGGSNECRSVDHGRVQDILECSMAL